MNATRIGRRDAVSQARTALRGMELARRKATFARTGAADEQGPCKARRLPAQVLRRSA